MNAFKKSVVMDELNFYRTAKKLLFYLFIIFLGISILVGILFGISLTINHPLVHGGILGAFIGIGLFIQIRQNFLFRKFGKMK